MVVAISVALPFHALTFKQLVLITENKDELMKFVNIPKTKVMLVPPTPQEKEFVGIIEECMNTKEKTLASKGHV